MHDSGMPPRGVSRSGLSATMPGAATARGGHDALHVRAVHFLVIIVVVDSGRNPLRAPFSPLLATLGVGILDGDVRWRRFAAVSDRFRAT
jgi:hypothetical protein